MKWLAWIVLLAAGCGRIGFEAQELDTGDDMPDSGATIDGALVLRDAALADAEPVPADAAPPDAAPPDAAPPDAAPPPGPTGDYSTNAPVQYTCAGGLLAIDFNALNFNDEGDALTITSNDVGAPAQPCVMSGAPMAGDDIFDVTCSLLGGCDEIYRLTGTFTDANTWTGTFTADFVGSCFGCMNQSIAVSGTRCEGVCPAAPL